MHPSKLTPVKIGYDDGLGNTEYVTAYTAEQMADALESAMDAAENYEALCRTAPFSAECKKAEFLWEAFKAKIKELRRDKEKNAN